MASFIDPALTDLVDLVHSHKHQPKCGALSWGFLHFIKHFAFLYGVLRQGHKMGVHGKGMFSAGVKST